MTNQERIQKLLGYSQEEYASMVEGAGYTWMQRYFGTQPDMINLIKVSGQFWKWWINQWEIRDGDFLFQTSLRFLDEPLEHLALQTALERYQEIHNVHALKIVPNNQVTTELGRMIREMDRKLKEQTNKLTHQPMSKIEVLEANLRLETGKRQLLDEILKAVKIGTGVTLEELQSPSRKREISDVRHAFWHLAMQQTEYRYSLSELGQLLCRDHCTVLHSLRKSKDLLCIDKQFKRIVQRITEHLPTTIKPMTEQEKRSASDVIQRQINSLEEWLVSHPQHPYRVAIQGDLRKLKDDLAQLSGEVIDVHSKTNIQS